jgi:signal transduction histidine kinase
MQPALVKIMEISASEAAIISIRDEEQNSLRLVAQRGIPNEYLIQLHTINLDESMLAWIEGMGMDDNIGSSAKLTAPIVFVIPGFHSASHISLRARGKSRGLLSCYRQTEIQYNIYQISFLNAIGEQLGMAVENYRLRFKAEEMATIQERQRLARELHDAVSQSLYSLTLFARSGRDAFEVGDHAKLLDSLELTDHVEQELFRIVSEALNNVLKHAGASQVSVTIRSKNKQLVLDVQDNGSGFDPVQEYTGMGLQNMRERAVALGGSVEIFSQDRKGTLIRVAIPQLYMLAKDG